MFTLIQLPCSERCVTNFFHLLTISVFSIFEQDVVSCNILEDASTFCRDLLRYDIPRETLVACIWKVPSLYFVTVMTEALCSPPQSVQ